MKSLELLETLRSRISAIEERVASALGDSMACGPGCSSCCILETVFAVEAFSIFLALESDCGFGKGFKPAQGDAREGTPSACPFLTSGGLCRVYHARPVICRTHGLPLLVDGKIDFCPKNFKGLKSMDSGLLTNLEALNESLAAINMIFRKENGDPRFDMDRIALAEVLKLSAK